METLPLLFEERSHNLEIYAQKQIFNRMAILNQLPMNQNIAGEFTNMLASENPDVKTGNPITTSEGVDFTEIKFGEPSTVRGSTRPKGFMFRMSKRVADRGRLDSTLQIFINKSIGRIINYYDDLFLKDLYEGAGATAPDDLNTIDSDSTGFDVLENEMKIIDAMEFQDDNDTGFTPTDYIGNRADILNIKIALAKSDLTDESLFNYVPTSKLATDKSVIMDMKNPTCTIEKFADPDYSILAKMESESETGRLYDENGNEVPPSFINIKISEPDEPQRSNYYIFTEAGINIMEPNGIMKI